MTRSRIQIASRIKRKPSSTSSSKPKTRFLYARRSNIPTSSSLYTFQKRPIISISSWNIVMAGIRFNISRDLDQYIKRNGPLKGKEAVRTIRSIVSAMSCLYDHGIIHRDIKPQNVLIKNG